MAEAGRVSASTAIIFALETFRERKAPMKFAVSFYFPMQKVEKIKFRISSVVVSPVSESR